MNNPEFEPDILESIDKSGYSEKQADLQVDKKGTARQQVKQLYTAPKKKFVKNQKKSAVIFKAK